MPATPSPFTAIVLAADRGNPDPVAQAAGVSCKAMAPVDGIPMVTRVIRALRASEAIDAIILCGPRPVVENDARLQKLIDSERIEWQPSRESPSTSAAAALKALQPIRRS